MKKPNLKRNEVLGKPQISAIYNATVPRLTLSLELILKRFTFSPTQEKLESLYRELLTPIEASSVRVTLDAYRIGARDVQMPIDNIQLISLRRNAQATAILAANQVTNTTANTFGLTYSFNAGLSVKDIDSRVRAGNISKHQMDINFYRGLRYGWSLNKMSRKRSFVSSEHDKDDVCDDNEEAGPIDVDDVFPSGDFETPFHFGCECQMILVR